MEKDSTHSHKVAKETHEWLKEVDSVALQSSVRHLADSFHKFFSKQGKAPRFKCRKNPAQSYTTRFTNNNISLQGNQLKLPKLGWIRFAKSRDIQGRILSATVRRSAAGRYFVSIVCETEIAPMPPKDVAIGIDFGLKKFAVCSRGPDIDNPKHLRKQEKKLARWQRIMARRKQGGTNWQRAKRKVAQIHEKILNSRQDFLHQLTTGWIRENQTICLEDLPFQPIVLQLRTSQPGSQEPCASGVGLSGMRKPSRSGQERK